MADVNKKRKSKGSERASREAKPKRAKTAASESQKEISFCRGFHPPTKAETAEALGDSPPVIFQKLLSSKLFSQVPKPTSIDDWLAQYKEEGQTFDQFLEETPWISTRKTKYYKGQFQWRGATLKEKYPNGKIYLKPIGDFDCDGYPELQSLAEYARMFLSLEVVLLPKVQVLYPENERDVVSFADDVIENAEDKVKSKNKRPTRNKRINFRMKDGQIQFQVQSIHAFLKSIMPDDALCLIGLTMTDLYEEKPDLFVAGMANGNQRVAVFSFSRYDPSLTFSKEYWYVVKKTKKVKTDEKHKLFLQRSCKLLVHEIMHLLGIAHYIWYNCCMNGSGHLDEDFRQPMFLCPVDLRKLYRLTGVDIVERYLKMKMFFAKHNLNEEVLWLQNVIKAVDSE